MNNSDPKPVPADKLLLHQGYRTQLNKLRNPLDQKKLFEMDAFIQPSDHCVQLGFPGVNGICVLPYQQEKPNVNPKAGRPDWRDAVIQWLRATQHLHIIPQAKELLDDVF